MNSPESKVVYLIDFGISKKYIDDGVHKSKARSNKFEGNLGFASHNAFIYKY
jgi:serine/threonine protein kinase